MNTLQIKFRYVINYTDGGTIRECVCDVFFTLKLIKYLHEVRKVSEYYPYQRKSTEKENVPKGSS
jgi:hypothetical protein